MFFDSESNRFILPESSGGPICMYTPLFPSVRITVECGRCHLVVLLQGTSAAQTTVTGVPMKSQGRLIT